MEGLIFFWISWLIWIYTTFLLSKQHPLRFKVSFCILVMIILSPYRVLILGYEIYIASFFLMFFILTQVVQLKRRMIAYFLISSLIVMIGYVSFHLLELFDPVWVIIEREWLLAIVLAYLTLMLQSNRLLRVATLFTGALQGEILYAFILNKFTFDYSIGSLAFLDIASLSVGVLLLWNGIELLVAHLEKLVNHLEREKQKLS